MSEVKHTPLPWRWVRRGCWCFVEDSNGDTIIDDGSVSGEYTPTISADDPNAAFIVKACNSHHALVEALELLMAHPVVSGMSAHIRDYSRQKGIKNPYELGKAALASTKGDEQ